MIIIPVLFILSGCLILCRESEVGSWVRSIDTCECHLDADYNESRDDTKLYLFHKYSCSMHILGPSIHK